jgi:hypothetical protein
VSVSSSNLPVALPDSGLLVARGLKAKAHNYKRLIAAILEWTSGEPFLTRYLCQLAIAAKDAPEPDRELSWISHLVNTVLVQHWRDRSELQHLRRIEAALSAQGRDSLRRLELYRQILLQDMAIAIDSAEQQQLQRLGLIVKNEGMLRVHNRAYEAIFHLAWADETLNALRRDLRPSDTALLQTLKDLEHQLLVSQMTALSQEGSPSADNHAVDVLYQTLRDVADRIGQLLEADRATIFLLNEDRTELWSVVAQNDRGDFLDIQVPVGEGIAGLVARDHKIIHIAENLYADPRAARVQETDRRYHYHTQNILAFPIRDDHGRTIAVIQLLNKLDRNHLDPKTQQPTVAAKGFTRADLERLARCADPVRQILETCQSSLHATRKLRASAALAEATRSLDEINLDTKAILQRVMNAAKKLMNADRSTLWLFDRDRGDLWTELPGKGEIRCEFGVGFVGKVAKARAPLNIPFDLYDHPDSLHAKRTDTQTQYRTCSLLCMPILSPEGELLGVTQLVNKRLPHADPEYDKSAWPKVPEGFKASFDKNDRQAMQVFNERVGVILQFIRSHETLKQLAEVEPSQAVYRSLAVLGHVLGERERDAPYETLCSMLGVVNTSICKALKVEHAMVFPFDPNEREFWALIREKQKTTPTDIHLPVTSGMAQALHTSKAIRVSNRVSSLGDPVLWRGLPKSFHNRVQHILLLPLVSDRGVVVGLVRLTNKLLSAGISQHPSLRHLSPKGFTRRDADRLRRCSTALLPIVQAFQLFYGDLRRIEAQRRAIDPLYRAISLVSQSSGNTEELIQKVMQGAKNLTNADRSTLWLIDPQKQELWTKIPQADGGVIEARVPIGEGYVGKVAQTGKTLNIPFDLYDRPDSATARKVDQETGYRTCSLLCMPIVGTEGDLLGVTQLVNKRTNNSQRPYVAAEWNGQPPDFFQASFTDKDRRDMEIFNNQVGVILPSIF